MARMACAPWFVANSASDISGHPTFRFLSGVHSPAFRRAKTHVKGKFYSRNLDVEFNLLGGVPRGRTPDMLPSLRIARSMSSRCARQIGLEIGGWKSL